jgi:hypothetical protein
VLRWENTPGELFVAHDEGYRRSARDDCGDHEGDYASKDALQVDHVQKIIEALLSASKKEQHAANAIHPAPRQLRCQLDGVGVVEVARVSMQADRCGEGGGWCSSAEASGGTNRSDRVSIFRSGRL